MSRGPKPKVWYDGEIYSCRSYNVEVPDLDTMPRMGALVWLLQNTTKRGYARKAPPPYFGGLTMVVR